MSIGTSPGSAANIIPARIELAVITCLGKPWTQCDIMDTISSKQKERVEEEAEADEPFGRRPWTDVNRPGGTREDYDPEARHCDQQVPRNEKPEHDVPLGQEQDGSNSSGNMSGEDATSQHQDAPRNRAEEGRSKRSRSDSRERDRPTAKENQGHGAIKVYNFNLRQSPMVTGDCAVSSFSYTALDSQRDFRLRLESVEDAIADYVHHRKTTLSVLRTWARDYADPWNGLRKMRKTIATAVWVALAAVWALCWMCPRGDVSAVTSSDAPAAPEPHQQARPGAVVAYSLALVLGAVFQLVTLWVFDSRSSHLHVRSAVGLGAVVLATGIVLRWAPLHFTDTVKLCVCIGVMVTPITRVRIAQRRTRQWAAGGVENVLAGLAGLFGGGIVYVAMPPDLIASACLLAALTVTRLLGMTDPRPKVMRDIEATARLRRALERVCALDDVVEQKPMQFVAEHAEKGQSPDFLLSIVELPEDIVSSVSAAVRLRKIPNSDVVRFVGETAARLERRSVLELQQQISRLRSEFAG